MYRIQYLDGTIREFDDNTIVDFANIVCRENGDDQNFTIITPIDAIDYIQQYCDNLQFILNEKKYYQIVCHTDSLSHYTEGIDKNITICGVKENDDWEEFNITEVDHLLEYQRCSKCLDLLKKDHPIGQIHADAKEIIANSLEVPIMINLPVYLTDKNELKELIKNIDPKDLAIFLRENLGYFKKLTVALVEANVDLTSIPNHKTDEE